MITIMTTMTMMIGIKQKIRWKIGIDFGGGVHCIPLFLWVKNIKPHDIESVSSI